MTVSPNGAIVGMSPTPSGADRTRLCSPVSRNSSPSSSSGAVLWLLSPFPSPLSICEVFAQGVPLARGSSMI